MPAVPQLLEQLREVADTRRALVAREVRAVLALREAGTSWRLIAEALGTTPQAAQQRFGRLGEE